VVLRVNIVHQHCMCWYRCALCLRVISVLMHGWHVLWLWLEVVLWRVLTIFVLGNFPTKTVALLQTTNVSWPLKCQAMFN